MMGLQDAVNGLRRAAHLRRDFAERTTVAIQLRDLGALTATNAALLTSLGETGSHALADANALLFGDRA